MAKNEMDDREDAKKPGPRTVIEDGTTFKGGLTSTLPVLVQGTVEGEVEASAITVGATGSLNGKVTAETLRTIGKIGGEYDVTTAQIAGIVADKTRVHAESLQIKVSAQSGRIALTFSSVQGKSGS